MAETTPQPGAAPPMIAPNRTPPDLLDRLPTMPRFYSVPGDGCVGLVGLGQPFGAAFVQLLESNGAVRAELRVDADGEPYIGLFHNGRLRSLVRLDRAGRPFARMFDSAGLEAGEVLVEDGTLTTIRAVLCRPADRSLPAESLQTVNHSE